MSPMSPMAAIDLTTANHSAAINFNAGLLPLQMSISTMPVPVPVPVAPVAPVTQNTIRRMQSRKMYVCPDCGKGLSHRYTLGRHRKTVCGKIRNTNGRWKCICGRRYESQGSLSRHIKFECHVDPQFQCIFCDSKFTQQCSLSRHLKKKHPNKVSAISH